jgi:dipeptidyl aminopeptidase/acylaminoacyl peptidase
MVAVGLLAGAGAGGAQQPLPGFKLDGTKWTYKDDEVSMEGIFLKPEGEGPFPAILISHGKGGSAAGFGPPKAREFVKWGFVCIAPNYTHAGGAAKQPGAKGSDGASEENIRRALQCVEILESLPYVDRKRIAAYGHSMGGFVTIGLAAAHPDRLKAAAITGSGIALKEGFPAPTAARAGKVRTPFLILHGSEDKTVRPAQAAAFKDVLDQNKVPNAYHVFPGENHPIDRNRQAEVFELMRQWFEKHDVLKPAGREGPHPPAGQKKPGGD